jgi:hypothetical protein
MMIAKRGVLLWPVAAILIVAALVARRMRLGECCASASAYDLLNLMVLRASGFEHTDDHEKERIFVD